MSINPDTSIEHDKLQAEVTAFVRSLGFLTATREYHKLYKEDRKLIDAMHRNYHPSCLHVRGGSDMIAIHENRQLAFEYEVKTRERNDYHDILIEALPLAHHLAGVRLGSECLYVQRDVTLNEDVGFLVSRCPPIRDILIPERWSAEVMDWFGRVLGKAFPQATVQQMPKNDGSGDPYVLIVRESFDNLPSWKDLIVGLVSKT